MKNFKKHTGFYLLLWVLLVASGNPVFAFSGEIQDTNQEFFRTAPDSKALVFEEITIPAVPQIISEEGWSYGFAFSREILLSAKALASQAELSYHLDKRNLLEHQVFPFHFFW